MNFDPYDHLLQDDPYPVYRRLRRESPLHHNTEHDFWVLTRHADVSAALRADRAYSNTMGVSMDKSAWSPHAHVVMSFLAMDPPEQSRLRKLVSRGFTPRRVAEMEPRIQRITDHYLDRLLTGAGPGATASFDWIGDLAGKVPMDVISEMLGVPEPDRVEVRRLADLLVQREDGLRDVPSAGLDAGLRLMEYYRNHVAERHRRPTDDLTSALLAADGEGTDGGADGGERMTDDEVVAFLFLMVVAGNETTTKLLGNAIYQLTAHPEQRDLVFGDPTLIPAWVEETLRFDTSTQLLARHLVEDVTLHDVTAPAGAQVLLALGSAGRDDAVFSAPDTFDVTRSKDELARILSFGGGRHYCLGASLARLEANIVLREVVRRFRTVEVDHERCLRFYSANVRGYAYLPVTAEVR
ncbi:cytochrome P450 [Cryptosporangium minutisporangium]|uniref:Cytochrome P450 n=1 Tax=Cryptosporangium minutisporangium TaxID=113569 RepID=A0ABP6SZI7_9ACTN